MQRALLVSLVCAALIVGLGGCGKKEPAPPLNPPNFQPPKQRPDRTGDNIPDMNDIMRRPERDDLIPAEPMTLAEAMEGLNNPEELERIAAVDGLLGIGTRAAEAGLREALQDPNEDVRYNVVYGLFDIPDKPLAVELMVVAMQDESKDVRLETVSSLHFFDDLAAAVPVLELALKDKVEEIRAEAVSVMEMEDLKELIPLLITALEDESEAVRDGAGDALEFATDQEFGADRAAWKRWWADNAKTFEFE